jgi:phosphatidylserine/phosphatidylglycerophosphate/cardiolipin synthase-like enzyme/uncharacterized membrane protein YdjX (TVP38/TMEM64 family)
VEREWNSAAKFTSETSGRLRFCFDATLPLGSAQHQKIVVIDRSVAFSGGLDLTIRRWDTSEHAVQHPLRVDPDGKPYPPFHDVQCMVDGEAAMALAEVAAERWRAAGCTVEDTGPVAGERWPASVPIQSRDIPAGIARTCIGTADCPAVNEVTRLFEASINTANRFIYIENQFTSTTEIAHLLTQRMRDVPSLRVLIVTPRAHSSWFESQAMQGGRGGFIDQFASAGVMDRVRFLYPSTRDADSAAAVMVHSKVMIVDDQLLRVGSANMNNRSMGADTECDLIFEATSEQHQEFIAGTRRRLIAHFCGVTEQDVEHHESGLLEYLDRLSAGGGARSLQPIDPTAMIGTVASIVQPVADPREPLHLERAAGRMWTMKTLLAAGGLAAALAGLAFAWQYTSLREFADVDFVSSIISRPARSEFAPLLAIAAFVVGGLLVFPVLVLIAATAAALGPWLGFASAATGVLLSSLLLFGIGRVLGHVRLQRLLGRRSSRIQNRIIGKGIVAVALIRMVPIAPFSIVNVVAGASKLSLRDFMLGTALGMAPGIAVMAALGAQIADLARNASLANALLLGVAIAAWIALCLGVQFLVTWLAGRRT